MVSGRPIVNLLDHFCDKVIPNYEDDHWALDTKMNDQGYQVMSIGGGRTSYGHIVAHELFIGPVPTGYDVDHQCNTTWCCNPAHLKAMTRSDNIRRAYDLCGAKLHDMTNPDNYYQRKDGRRLCKPCNHRRNRARYGKQ